ncbi:hypothetical protein EVAR_27551_1 [Eumeta japonica]|uniref:Uncharacterized protein n=1 Tax=Eumeta variegata TaxID=151549 RepID=A0A4C1WDG3_EUMVA|nr:hypothetical protein EVAR_27551_1 [Eumeta japonica]
MSRCRRTPAAAAGVTTMKRLETKGHLIVFPKLGNNFGQFGLVSYFDPAYFLYRSRCRSRLGLNTDSHFLDDAFGAYSRFAKIWIQNNELRFYRTDLFGMRVSSYVLSILRENKKKVPLILRDALTTDNVTTRVQSPTAAAAGPDDDAGRISIRLSITAVSGERP